MADLKRLQVQDEEDLRKEQERNGWWAFLASPVFGKRNETGEQKRARETNRLHRLASKSIKESELHEKEVKIQQLQAALQRVKSTIAAETKKLEDEAWAQARASALRMEQEARERALRETRERMAKARKDQAEREAREAREAQAAREEAVREAREAEERSQKAAAAEMRRRREAEERAQALRQETPRRVKKTRNDRSEPAPPVYGFSAAFGSRENTCRHAGFWPEVKGRQLCSSCRTFQRRFAFQCPRCRILACANCRQTLKGEN